MPQKHDKIHFLKGPEKSPDTLLSFHLSGRIIDQSTSFLAQDIPESHIQQLNKIDQELIVF